MRRKCCVRRCNELGRCLAVEAPQAGGIVVHDEGVEAGIIAFGMVDKTAGWAVPFCGVRSRCSPTRRFTGSTKAAFSDGDRPIPPMAFIVIGRTQLSGRGMKETAYAVPSAAKLPFDVLEVRMESNAPQTWPVAEALSFVEPRAAWQSFRGYTGRKDGRHVALAPHPALVACRRDRRHVPRHDNQYWCWCRCRNPAQHATRLARRRQPARRGMRPPPRLF